MSDPGEPPAEAPDTSRAPSRARRIVLLIAVIVIAAGAVGVAVYEAKLYFSPSPRLAEQGGDYPALPADFGSEDAALKIEVCVGPCITFVPIRIIDAVDEWPELVRVDTYDYFSEEGEQFVQDHGEGLACIFVNGENDFTVTVDGEQRSVHMVGPPGESAYTMRDVAAVIEQAWREVHGELPQGLEGELRKMSRENP